MPRLALTDLTVRSLKTDRQTDFWDTKLPSFGVRVGPRSKSFIVKIGNSRRTLGTYPDLSLQDARRAAQFEKLAPASVSSVSITFKEAYDQFASIHIRRKKGSTQENYEGHFDRHFLKPLGSKRLDEISHKDIMSITDKLTPSNQAYALAVIRIFWNFCRRRQLTKNNPVDTLRAQQSKSRDRVLSDAELKGLWAATAEPTTYNCIVRMLLLTGQRRGEIAALQTSWIKENNLCLPATITKNGHPHTIPIGTLFGTLLSAAAVDTQSGFLFPARGAGLTPFNGWSKSKHALDKKLGPDFAPWTLHDLRRTFATNMAKLGVRLEVTEKILNHVSGSTGGIVGVYMKYNFETEMRAAIELWEAKLASIVA